MVCLPVVFTWFELKEPWLRLILWELVCFKLVWLADGVIFGEFILDDGWLFDEGPRDSSSTQRLYKDRQTFERYLLDWLNKM